MNQCPICESTKSELLFTNSRGNKYLENFVCDFCGFVYTYPRISNEQINELYIEGTFSKDARKSTIPDLSKFIQTEKMAMERVHFLENELPEFFSDKKSCLDIGCGTGSFLWLLKNRKHIVKGIEPDSTFVKVAQDRYDIDVESVLIENFSSSSSFDLICNFHVIEHILSPKDFVRFMHSNLKEDGIIYLECPSIDNIYTQDLNTFFWDVHVNTFSNLSLPWLLESEGFSIIKVSLYNGFLSIIAKKELNSSIQCQKDNKKRILCLIQEQLKKSKLRNRKSFFNKSKSKVKHLITKVIR